MFDASESPESWLLLVHQLPPKPDYFRVKVGRRLQRTGAIPIKNSVYALPDGAETREDFEWLLREIREGGGEAMIGRVEMIAGLRDEDVKGLFRAARGAEYAEVAVEARSLLRDIPQGPLPADARPALERGVSRLRRRIEAVREIDFFAADEAAAAEAAMRALERRVRSATRAAGSRTTRGGRKAAGPGRTWVTRRGVKVDRIASAWLIRRFIDPQARFRFVDPQGHRPAPGELRFDMFEAEYGHVGDACTFETLLRCHRSKDAALRHLAEIVHDVDCKDGKFGREEAPGLARIVAGIAAAHERDEDRIERGSVVFDELYAAFASPRGGRRPKS